jgi:hypothetical protein
VHMREPSGADADNDINKVRRGRSHWPAYLLSHWHLERDGRYGIKLDSVNRMI